MISWIPLVMFAAICPILMLGYPVAFTLAGVSLYFAAGGIISGTFDPALLGTIPGRLYGLMTNTTLIAVPLFIMMGVTLEKSNMAEELLSVMGRLLCRVKGGLCVSVVLVGMLLAASTGIVGATVVTMGLMSLPTMLAKGYHPRLATGTICATGTLGQIIPPSIALVLLGDILSTAFQQSQLTMGVHNPDTVSVGDLFLGAVVPGLLLVLFYLIYVVSVSVLKPEYVGAAEDDQHYPSLSELVSGLLPPLCLIIAVLGSIFSGLATPTEAAGVGAAGAVLIAAVRKKMSLSVLKEIAESTMSVTSMVFMILIGATVFSLVFRGFGGEELIQHVFSQLPGGVTGAVALVMLVVFLLGFILDFIEITFVVVPIVAPVLFAMGVDPVWLGIMLAVNLQTSFLTPPFGFALFYLRGVAPADVRTSDIYLGVAPFIVIQLLLLLLLSLFPGMVKLV